MHRPATANDRFKERFGAAFWLALIAATVLHTLVFVRSPSFALAGGSTTSSVTKVDALPDAAIPDPPPTIQRPADPKIVTGPVDDPDLTIPPTIPGSEGAFDLAPPAPSDDDAGRAPTFVPYDVAPELRNPGEIQAALRRMYPSVLRDAGVEGTVRVWVHIDDRGRVLETRVQESSGYDGFDRAALQVVDRMEFSPAYNRDRRVQVWVSLDITFEVQ